jgi:hypothetical protein
MPEYIEGLEFSAQFPRVAEGHADASQDRDIQSAK